ncbi:MAG: Rne/Rng family ribonuclease [Deltaproteobacteria bacterium]|nr:Rne/Rng family ribonuclease [Deltaproteobacteria bacterium]
MSGNLLVVNADGPETRVALVENGILSELFIERKRERGIVGNIYKGRVVRVLPGMQASFVDIGTEKAAFLYVADVRGAGDERSLFADEDEREVQEEPQVDQARAIRGQKIENLLREGQEVLVQVAKEPMGTKGARVTTYVSLPGRHLVFMPGVDHVGISRRIASEKERKRLRDIVEAHRAKGTGFIVRTVAEGASEQELRDDMDFLTKLWRETLRKSERAKPASLVYSDLDLLLRSVRDNLTPEVDRLIIDSRTEYDRVHKFVAAFMPQFLGRVELYEGTEPIFDGFGIEVEIDRALERKVWLKSGGYLIYDEGEALTAIDVNTGRFVGKKNLEETITKNNLEACREVADQLRLRNIGGIIVVDFIDMDRESNREKVWKAFNEALQRDRAKSNVSKISELGLVEMTRKRTRESLSRTLTEPCFYCEGKGYLKSKTTICYEILRELRRQGGAVKEDAVVIACHPEIAAQLQTVDKDFLEETEKRLQKRVQIKGRGSFHIEQYEILGKKAAERRKGKGGSEEEGNLNSIEVEGEQEDRPAR